MAENTKWTPFGEFDPSKDFADQVPPAPPSPKSTNPFFQRLEDVVFDPFASTPPKKTESEEKVGGKVDKQGSGSEVKRSFDGTPTLGEEPQYTQVSSEYRFVVLPEVKRWGETPLCLTGLKKKDWKKHSQKKASKPKKTANGSFYATNTKYDFGGSTAKPAKDAAEKKDFSSMLPEASMVRIFSYLSAADVLHAGQANRRWNSLADSESLWKPRVVSQYGNQEIVHFGFDRTICWREEIGSRRWKRLYFSREKERGAGTKASGIVLKKNEIYLDVIERLDVHINTNGAVQHADILGKVTAECLLAERGTCEVLSNISETGANLKSAPPIRLDDVTLHSCVDHKQFTPSFAKISFTPPGSQRFHLMRYRLTNQKARLPFKLHVLYMKDLDRHAYQIDVELVSSFKDKQQLPEVRLIAPVPSASYVKCQIKTASAGKAEYHAAPTNAIVWTIPSCAVSTTHKLSADVVIPRNESLDWTRPPLRLECSPLLCSSSGFHLTSVKTGNAKADIWVRYISGVSTFTHNV